MYDTQIDVAKLKGQLQPGVADPHHFDADPDPAFYSDADPDPSTHFFPDLGSGIQNSNMLKNLFHNLQFV
jgi:hypothetical protein